MTVETVQVPCRDVVRLDDWSPNMDCVSVNFQLFNKLLVIIIVCKQVFFVVSKKELVRFEELVQLSFFFAS